MFVPVSPSDPGPKLWLPGRYAGAMVDAVVARQESLSRPEHYILEVPETTIIVANGSDINWRAPLDEVKAMAQERLEEFRQSDKFLSAADRRDAFNRALLEKVEREVRATKQPGFTQITRT